MRSQERLGEEEICVQDAEKTNLQPSSSGADCPSLWEQTSTAHPPHSLQNASIVYWRPISLKRQLKLRLTNVTCPLQHFPEGSDVRASSAHRAPPLSLPSGPAALDQATGRGRRAVGISPYSGSRPGNFLQSNASHSGFVWYRPHWLNFHAAYAKNNLTSLSHSVILPNSGTSLPFQLLNPLK